eukprot:RCo019303
MSTHRHFTVTVTVSWLRGVALGPPARLQAVWELFGVPQQTEAQPILPDLDTAPPGATGVVLWDEVFEFPDLPLPCGGAKGSNEGDSLGDQQGQGPAGAAEEEQYLSL